MNSIVLIGCAKTKLPGIHPACELYRSRLFRLSFAYAVLQNFGPRKFILSAKHGLLSPNKRIKSYDQSLQEMTAQERRQWAKKVARQIKAQFLPPGWEIHFLCGEDYQRDLMTELGDGFVYHIPMRGLSLGKQVQWLQQRVIDPEVYRKMKEIK